jgi:uncharacterized protein with ParB-like and HNH nuclease domain
MSLKILLECIENNDLESFKLIMEDDKTYLTNKICTRLLIESLEKNYTQISNYILKFAFDLDADLFEKYLEENRPFNERQIQNLNKILNKLYICCLVNS